MKKAVFLAFLALAACKGREPKKTDSALAADLALASQMSAAQPQLSDTGNGVAADPRAPGRAPARIDNSPRTRVMPRPAPVAQAGDANVPARAIGAGTSLALVSQQRICTGTNRPGDRFVATLIRPVTGSNGAVIPSGSSVVLEVTSVYSGPNQSDARIALVVHSVEFNGMSYPLSGPVDTQGELERSRIMSDQNADKKKVIGGAVAGAILGRVIGGSTKGTVIGAAAGAATGAAAAKAGERWEACLPVGGPMTLTLDRIVVL